VWGQYLFSDENLDATRATRDPVITAKPNKNVANKKAKHAKIKFVTKQEGNATETQEGEHQVESFQTLLSNLATICRNNCQIADESDEQHITFNTLTIPNSFQEELLNQIKNITTPNSPQQ
jgi:hypothetical protein